MITFSLLSLWDIWGPIQLICLLEVTWIKKTRSGVNLSSILCNSIHTRTHTSLAHKTHTVTTFSWRKKSMITICKWKQVPFHLEDNSGFDNVWINNFCQLWMSFISFYLWCLRSYLLPCLHNQTQHYSPCRKFHICNIVLQMGEWVKQLMYF